MKRLILSVIVLLTGIYVSAQNQATASGIAEKIAQRMKDSLSLSEQQKSTIYSINMDLYNRKTQLRQQYNGSDSIQYYIQKVESTRDSLYRNLMTEEKYLLYKSKKRNLISNN